MKTILKYESRIQENLIGLLLILIIATVARVDWLWILLLVDFILIAIFQYTINLIKFFQKSYKKTLSRKIYVFLSTYCLLMFLGLISFKVFDKDFSASFFNFCIWSLVIFPPILIIQSLIISYSDKKEIYEKPAI
ncbi:hypothetical protein [Epilithonimonas zeae]|uniref:hypothetical protein n=1 Tax=Epilithonimonas zeae TaxID=1416779 RepID=UPI00200FD955|nr:hypothetical protein [Epilithonimonas zeae]UQB69771.1 hypothetical protein KI430_04895 [Epilithonimonas zeae]